MTTPHSQRDHSSKIINPDQLDEMLRELHEKGRRVVLFPFRPVNIQSSTGGTPIHSEDIREMEAARSLGDSLCVIYEESNAKGSDAPSFDCNAILTLLAALEIVDLVIIVPSEDIVSVVERIHPAIYCVSSRHELSSQERKAISSIGAELHFLWDESAKEIARGELGLQLLPPEAKTWLEDFREQYAFEDVTRILKECGKLKALVVGETIIDEYVFVDGLGKSSKDPILAFKFRNQETYAGGALAVANHAAGFCKNVGLLTYLGERERMESFARSSLRKNVQPLFLSHANAPTIRKRRYIDQHTLAKVFEVYLMDDTPPSETEATKLAVQFQQMEKDYDLIIVTDYGHGMMGNPIREALANSNSFLAVNTQANAGNRGFNTISKYKRADYVCLAGHEVELETRLRYAPFNELIRQVEKFIDCRNFTITLGRQGTLHNTSGNDFIHIPAFATRVKDRVGAGDAVLSISSLLAKLNVSWDVIGLISNLAGAEMVDQLGNSAFINRKDLEKHLSILFS